MGQNQGVRGFYPRDGPEGAPYRPLFQHPAGMAPAKPSARFALGVFHRLVFAYEIASERHSRRVT